MPGKRDADLETKLAVLRLAASAIDLRKNINEREIKKIPGLSMALDELVAIFERLVRETAR
jgi:hypothetical protein